MSDPVYKNLGENSWPKYSNGTDMGDIEEQQDDDVSSKAVYLDEAVQSEQEKRKEPLSNLTKMHGEYRVR